MSVKIKYIDQSASELRLNVIEGCIDYKQLCIIVSDSFIFGKLKVSAFIIGASHVLRIKAGDYVFNEIFACVDIESSNRILLSGKLENLSERFIDLEFSKLGYKFKVNTYEWEKGILISDEIEKGWLNALPTGRAINLLYEFPGNNGVRNPKTLVNVELDVSDIKVETVHSYPNEKKIVITNSVINIKEEIT